MSSKLALAYFPGKKILNCSTWRETRQRLFHLIEETELRVHRGQGGSKETRTEKESTTQSEISKDLLGSQSSLSTNDEPLSVRKQLAARARHP